MGILRLRKSKNGSPTELHTVVVEPLEVCLIISGGPQSERLVQTSDQINMTDLNCKAKVNVGI
jgi:hypothetical protein